MNAASVLFYTLAVLALLGALGAVMSRTFAHAILFGLLATLSTCGIVCLCQNEILGAIVAWFLASTNLLTLFHISSVIGLEERRPIPTRLLITNFSFAALTLTVSGYLAPLIDTPTQTDANQPAWVAQDFLPSFGSSYGFALFLVLASAPLVMICSLLLSTREESASALPNVDTKGGI
jgi:NADH:ubiquinone oxidoreductase subunit 6 (subunit J)